MQPAPGPTDLLAARRDRAPQGRDEGGRRRWRDGQRFGDGRHNWAAPADACLHGIADRGCGSDRRRPQHRRNSVRAPTVSTSSRPALMIRSTDGNRSRRSATMSYANRLAGPRSSGVADVRYGLSEPSVTFCLTHGAPRQWFVVAAGSVAGRSNPITVVIGTPSLSGSGRGIRRVREARGHHTLLPKPGNSPDAKPTGPGLERLGRTCPCGRPARSRIVGRLLGSIGRLSSSRVDAGPISGSGKQSRDWNGDHWVASCASSCGLESGDAVQVSRRVVETLLVDGEHVDGARTAYEDELG